MRAQTEKTTFSCKDYCRRAAIFCMGPPKFPTFYGLTQMKIIELKQGSKFEFVHGLNVYKKYYQFLCNGPLEGASFLSPNKNESVQHGKALYILNFD